MKTCLECGETYTGWKKNHQCPPAECVACGEVYIGKNHHCDPIREAKIENSRKSHAMLGREESRPTGLRILQGFAIMRESGQ